MRPVVMAMMPPTANRVMLHFGLHQYFSAGGLVSVMDWWYLAFLGNRDVEARKSLCVALPAAGSVWPCGTSRTQPLSFTWRWCTWARPDLADVPAPTDSKIPGWENESSLHPAPMRPIHSRLCNGFSSWSNSLGPTRMRMPSRCTSSGYSGRATRARQEERACWLTRGR